MNETRVTQSAAWLNTVDECTQVVMDSVAFQFRVDFKDYALRSRLLSSMASKLTRLAVDRNIAVALINQITTKFEGQGSSSSSFLAPALGETWAHACTSRVMLYWQDGQRYARLYKSPSRKNDCVPYMVTPDGVSDHFRLFLLFPEDLVNMKRCPKCRQTEKVADSSAKCCIGEFLFTNTHAT